MVTIVVIVSSATPQSGMVVWEVVLQKCPRITVMNWMARIRSLHITTLSSTIPNFLVCSLTQWILPMGGTMACIQRMRIAREATRCILQRAKTCTHSIIMKDSTAITNLIRNQLIQGPIGMGTTWINNIEDLDHSILHHPKMGLSYALKDLLLPTDLHMVKVHLSVRVTTGMRITITTGAKNGVLRDLHRN